VETTFGVWWGVVSGSGDCSVEFVSELDGVVLVLPRFGIEIIITKETAAT
jgi:hypothetical protein